MLPTPTMSSLFPDDAHLVVLFQVGVKRGVICNSSNPADPVLTPGMSHEITPSWIKKKKSKERNYGWSFKNTYKTQKPWGYSHNALQFITRSDVMRRGWGLTLTNAQDHGAAGANSGQPPCSGPKGWQRLHYRLLAVGSAVTQRISLPASIKGRKSENDTDDETKRAKASRKFSSGNTQQNDNPQKRK